MSAFTRALAETQRPLDPSGRRWVFVPYDQLTDRIGPLARLAPREAGIVVVECPAKAARRPYHRQKLATILANLRHFALEQGRRGVAVRHVIASGDYASALDPLVDELGPLELMEPAERELRVDLAPLRNRGRLRVRHHEGWLTTPDLFFASQSPDRPWRMDAFYRHARRELDVLMERGKPAGGKFSFDAENRRAWRGEPPAPEPPRFDPDVITLEVGALIETRLHRHPGQLDLTALPATARDARTLWAWARSASLPHFGPHQDAMSVRSSGLFHSRISALLHLHRLLPREVVDDALALPIDRASKEGFVRQVLGWREFVRHVHRATDGLRRLPDGLATPPDPGPGDGGWSRWRGEPWRAEARSEEDRGACPSALGADRPLPPAFWGEPSGLACLDHVVREVWREGYGHHITRLMVLANLATLLDVSPRELTDWFWVAYADAFDWVVEPNVLGMGTYGVGELMTTKPYVCGSAYIDRMSDYCAGCAFDPKKTCPITRLYWAFLDRHQETLRSNHRVGRVLANVRRRAPERRAEDRAISALLQTRLGAGERVVPADLQRALAEV